MAGILRFFKMFRDAAAYICLSTKERIANKRKSGGFMYAFQKAAVLLALVLWIVAAANVVVSGWKRMGKEQIISAFNSETYTDIRASIASMGKYGDFNITDNAKKLILEDIAEDIGINRYTIEDTIEEGNKVKTLSQSSDNGNVVCKFITVGEVPEAECGQYIYIGINLNNSAEAAFSYEEIVKNINEKLGTNSTVTVNLVGEMQGQLSSGVKDMIVDGMLNNINAKIVVQNRDDELYTVYAYDGDIKEYVKLGKDKVNVNLSIAYDEERDVTMVYLSTPINNQDY